MRPLLPFFALCGIARGDYVITSVYPGTACAGDVLAAQVQYPTGCNDVGLLQSYSLKCVNGSSVVYVHDSRHCTGAGNITGMFPDGCIKNPESLPALRGVLDQSAIATSGFMKCIASPRPFAPPALNVAYSAASFDRLPTCPSSLMAGGDAVGAVTSAAPYRSCVRTGASSSLTFDCNSTSLFASVFDASER